ncbi:uncharacterized protein LOC126665107 [Mercurialis annua]|uniref:uncharacterized protein LOC126665107 n=1 Tax=Mercurialis annua TaxID=3986 RepID=UPI002160CFC6|nr:uncharacterized protein LOC126665107 [Mercurialis annua]
MATHNEKQKRGFLMKLYKYSISTTKNYNPKHIDSNINIVANKPVVLHNLLTTKLEDYDQQVPEMGAAVVAVGGGGGGGERRGGGGRNVVVEGRKSVSHVETNIKSVASFLQVRVLVTDMPAFMQIHAFRCARTTFDSLEKFSPKHVAYNIKKEFDKVYGPAWHCIVGSSFGSFVTHSTGCFLYFSMEKLYILVFKTKVQKTLGSSS